MTYITYEGTITLKDGRSRRKVENILSEYDIACTDEANKKELNIGGCSIDPDWEPDDPFVELMSLVTYGKVHFVGEYDEGTDDIMFVIHPDYIESVSKTDLGYFRGVDDPMDIAKQLPREVQDAVLRLNGVDRVHFAV